MYNVFNTPLEHPYGAPSPSPWLPAVSSGEMCRCPIQSGQNDDDNKGIQIPLSPSKSATICDHGSSSMLHASDEQQPTTHLHRRAAHDPSTRAASVRPHPAGPPIRSQRPSSICITPTSNHPHPASCLQPSAPSSTRTSTLLPRHQIPSSLSSPKPICLFVRPAKIRWPRSIHAQITASIDRPHLPPPSTTNTMIRRPPQQPNSSTISRPSSPNPSMNPPKPHRLPRRPAAMAHQYHDPTPSRPNFSPNSCHFGHWGGSIEDTEDVGEAAIHTELGTFVKGSKQERKAET
ncbi:hypothetical protein ACLOJK_037216, partial [Asimina triloba]